MSPQIFSGPVLHSDLELLRFQIGDRIFYAVKWLVSHPKSFPSNHGTVTVTLCDDAVHTIGSGNVTVLCGKCDLRSTGTVRVPDDNLFSFVLRKYGLENGRFAKIHDLFETLEDRVRNVAPGVNVGGTVIGIVVEVLRCSDVDLEDVSVKPVSRFRAVDDRNVGRRFWTYSVRQKSPDNEYVFGYVQVGGHGVPVLCDAKWRVPIKMFGNENVSRFVNRFVLIRKCTVITEMYDAEQTEPVSCVLSDLDDVVLLKFVPRLCRERINVIEEKVTRKYTTTFTLLHIGPICVGHNETEQCWLRGRSDELGDVFVVLGGPLINVRALVSINQDYTIMHDEQRTPVVWNEINRLEKNVPAYLFKNPMTKFLARPNSKGDNDPVLLDVDEAVEKFQSLAGLINVTGLITDKTFCAGNDSFYGGKRRRQPFGTPGNKTHKIHLKSKDGDLTIFLNDFNRYVAPFGLLPGMVVNVYKLMPQQKGYCKCTALTTFELVRWNGKSNDITNLNRTPKNEKVFLSLQHTISNNTTHLANLKVVTVKSGYLAYQYSSETLEIKLTLNCKDEFGKFSVVLTSEKVLKAMLGFSDFSYDLFFKAFKDVGTFRYPNTYVKQDSKGDVNQFKYALNALLECWHYRIFDVPVYVQKSESAGSVPVYTTVDV